MCVVLFSLSLWCDGVRIEYYRVLVAARGYLSLWLRLAHSLARSGSAVAAGAV
jgi:hypothetical protein